MSSQANTPHRMPPTPRRAASAAQQDDHDDDEDGVGPSGTGGSGGVGSGARKEYVRPVEMDWEPFQRKLVTFWNAIDEYVATSKAAIQEHTTLHVETLRGLKVEKSELEKKIAEERDRERKMLAVLEQERTNISDLTTSLQRLNLSLTSLRTQSSSLEGDVNKLKREVGSTRGEKERQKGVLEKQKSRDEPELSRLEEMLGWKVEGVKDNVLLMSFTQIDPSDPGKVYSLIIDMSSSDGYEVPNCDPPLPNIHELVNKLNEDKQFYAFVKRVRQAFRQTVTDREPANKDDELFSGVGGPKQQQQHGGSSTSV